LFSSLVDAARLDVFAAAPSEPANRRRAPNAPAEHMPHWLLGFCFGAQPDQAPGVDFQWTISRRDVPSRSGTRPDCGVRPLGFDPAQID
jgi:hypothetical protein